MEKIGMVILNGVFFVIGIIKKGGLLGFVLGLVFGRLFGNNCAIRFPEIAVRPSSISRLGFSMINQPFYEWFMNGL